MVHVPTNTDLGPLGCITFAESGRAEPNQVPFGHVDWPAVRAACARR